MKFSLYSFLFLQLVFVGFLDYKYRKISNNWIILNLLLLPLIAYLFSSDFLIFSSDGLNILHFRYSVLFLLIGFVLFLLKIMGAGDSKYLFSFFLLVPLKLQDSFFEYLILSTVVFASTVLLFKLFKKPQVLRDVIQFRSLSYFKEILGSKIPYAPVIMFAWICLGLDIKIWERL